MSDVISLLDSQAHLLGIVFNLQVTDEPALVYAEENQLKQVFINLLKNSMEAMSKGGIITIHLFLEEKTLKSSYGTRERVFPQKCCPSWENLFHKQRNRYRTRTYGQPAYYTES